jgi:hypothetical protein
MKRIWRLIRPQEEVLNAIVEAFGEGTDMHDDMAELLTRDDDPLDQMDALNDWYRVYGFLFEESFGPIDDES